MAWQTGLHPQPDRKEIAEANSAPIGDLKDPVARNANLPPEEQATDIARSAGKGKENWIVMIGSCTHLGCVPLGTSGNMAGGSVPAMGRSTTLPVVSGRVPHP